MCVCASVSGTTDPVGPWYQMGSLYPSIRAPQWLGPRYTYNSTYNGVGGYVDFYFICRIEAASPPQTDDGARFDVFLTFDSRLSSVKRTATLRSLDVVFTSDDVNDGFATEVCTDRL